MVPKQVVPDRHGVVEIGKYKENLVTEVAFDCADLGDGSGAYAVVFQRPKDTAPYPVTFRAEWPNIIWIVQAADTAKPGTGKVEIRWFGDGEEVGKSKTYMIRVNDGLPDPTAAPQEWAGYIGQVAQNAERAENAAGKAETAAKTAAADADAAKAARTGAEQAEANAGDAAGAAAEAALAAQTAQTSATNAAAAAGTAQTGAETARDAAGKSATAAAQSQTEAGSSAAAAASSAQAAADTLAQVKDDLAAGKLKGEKGDKGDTGERGPQGETGPQGPAGDPAPQIDDSVDSPDNPWSGRKVAAEIGVVRAAAEGTAAELAETKAELATAKKELAETQRAVRFAAKLSQGQTWDFETDDAAAYSRQIPSGAYAGAVKGFGGKTVAWNQLASIKTAASTDYNFLNVKMSTGAFAPTHKYYFADTAAETDGTDFSFSSVGFWNATMDKFVRAVTTTIRKDGKSAIVASFEKLPEGVAASDLSNIVFQYIGDNSAKDSRVSVQDMTVVDLTRLYGPGNEPTTTDDPRIAQIEAYAAEHPEYNGGELVSAAVDGVKVRGRNELTLDMLDTRFSAYLGRAITRDTSMLIALKPGKTVPAVFFGFIRMALDGHTTATWFTTADATWPVNYAVEKINASAYKQQFICVYPATDAAVAAIKDAFDVMVVSGTVAKDDMLYAPYRLNAYPIPSAVQALPGYGWSAGDVCNTIARTDNGWQYVQRVDSVDLGTLTWSMFNTNLYACKQIAGKIAAPSSGATPNVSCNQLTSVTRADVYTTDKSIAVAESGYQFDRYIFVRDTACATASEMIAAFKAANAVMYYELAAPITTDITALMADALAPFATEPGGSITLHHALADDGLALDVPGTVEYVTKLSEVVDNG